MWNKRSFTFVCGFHFNPHFVSVTRSFKHQNVKEFFPQLTEKSYRILHSFDNSLTITKSWWRQKIHFKAPWGRCRLSVSSLTGVVLFHFIHTIYKRGPERKCAVTEVILSWSYYICFAAALTIIIIFLGFVQEIECWSYKIYIMLRHTVSQSVFSYCLTTAFRNTSSLAIILIH